MAESETYHKNTKEQYEALGRFVKAFEAMVHQTRMSSIGIIAHDLNDFKKGLVATSFFHPGIGAKPIYDIFIALISGACKSELFRMANQIDTEDLPRLSSILSEINGEYERLCNKRNNLLHGTWYIGHENPADWESSMFHVSRFAVGASGVVPVQLPKTATELLKLAARCEETRDWIATVYVSVIGKADCRILECFRQYQFGRKEKEKRWERIWPSHGRLHTGPD
jgi:hypothetical protein